VLVLEPLLGNLPPPLSVGVLQLVFGRLFGLSGVADLFADLVYEGTEFVVRATLHLGLKLIDPLDEGFNAVELAVVRIDEAAQKAKH
jgi:hypothetical protein